ncbi:TerC/Alx family metal homeostasis membrane protein, partial [Chloroflexota bacterium]
MEYSIWLWIGFSAFVIIMLILDLGFFHREVHTISVREAAIWSAIWISLSLLFNAGIYLWIGHQQGTEFLTGYIIEKSLSIDNVFVWMIIFSYFSVPAQYQHRVLFLGVLGAIISRGFFIAIGVTLLNTFHWIIYIFGAFLIFTGIRLALRKEEKIHPERNPILKIVRHFINVSPDYQGQKFFIRHKGKLIATPLFLVLLVVETTDLVFAIDSVPAILAITKDAFIV